MSSGALLGGLLGLAWTHLWPGSPVGAYAMVGAAVTRHLGGYSIYTARLPAAAPSA
ncbi:MAG: hypothetical protein QOE71_2433 [Pseudonocardiales bacterium]|jgi:hypothetical protein|nr:hypothetical protein [Pseudonocardiales bacterium]